jgi:hypothetical protein
MFSFMITDLPVRGKVSRPLSIAARAIPRTMMPKSGNRFSGDITDQRVDFAACMRREVMLLRCNMLQGSSGVIQSFDRLQAGCAGLPG